MVTIANSISHLEALRTRSPESHAVDNATVSLVDRCMEACIQWEQYGAAALSEMEQQLALVCVSFFSSASCTRVFSVVLQAIVCVIYTRVRIDRHFHLNT